MGYRVELFVISDFLPVRYRYGTVPYSTVRRYRTLILIALDKDYSDTRPIKGLYLKSTRSTVRETATSANCKFSPYRREQTGCSGCECQGLSAAFKYVNGEFLRKGSGFFYGPVLFAYAICTSASLEASVAYAATDTCLVNVQP